MNGKETMEMSIVLETVTAVTPPLKWAGGKRWQVPHIRPYWEANTHRRLVEPFCGGLAVTLGLMPERALVNDINPHLMNFYRQVQSTGLSDALAFGHDANNETFYYKMRVWFNQLVKEPGYESGTPGCETETAASLFYYLNRTGFNGLCRFNSKGGFNVPFGKFKTINYRQDFSAEQAVLSGWTLTCGSFDALRIEPEDFIYADPPYDVEFTTYSAGGFGWKDQIRTAEWLAAHPGPVLLSNQATPRIIDLYQSLGFALQYLDAPRRISCTGDRTPAREVLARRNTWEPN